MFLNQILSGQHWFLADSTKIVTYIKKRKTITPTEDKVKIYMERCSSMLSPLDTLQIDALLHHLP
jgi:hypothetical protein